MAAPGVTPELIRTYRRSSLLTATAIVAFGVVRHLKSGEFYDPLALRGLVGGSFVAAALTSYAHPRLARALPSTFLALCFVFVGWTIWLGWNNDFDSSFANTVNLIVLICGLGLGVLRSGVKGVVAFLAFSCTASILAIATTEAPKADPRTFSIGLVGASVSVVVTLILNQRARRQVAESQLQWEQLVEHHPDAIVLAGPDGRVAYTNQAARQAFQAVLDEPEASSRKELVGRTLEDLAPNDPEWATRALASIRETNGDLRTYTLKRGEVRFEGQAMLQLVLHDETKQRQTQELLVQAKQHAEETAAAKATFLAMTSHEIRTPLNGILGLTDLLRDRGDLSTDVRSMLDVIHTSGDSLLMVLNDVLDFSKIEAGRLDLEAVDFSLEELAQSTTEILRPRANEAGIALEYTVAEGSARTVRGDPLRIRQILLNYLSNAVKFTTRGGVQLTLATGPRPDGRLDLEVWVRDTGPGIPPDRLDAVFGAFSQADPSTSRRYGGTGLGLSICQRLAELMEGEVGVTSEVGKGSCFSARIVVEPGREASSLDRVREDRRPLELRHDLKVLVADDNPVNQMVVGQFLRREGLEADVVSDGRQAVEAARRQNYDLIFLDMMMPEMTGLEAARVIRELPGPHRPALVALTANAMDSDREACRNAGMEGFLTKPLRREALRRVLMSCVPG